MISKNNGNVRYFSNSINAAYNISNHANNQQNLIHIKLKHKQHETEALLSTNIWFSVKENSIHISEKQEKVDWNFRS